MISETTTICNKLGLHARAAAAFVKTANKYKCEVTVKKENAKVNGKSIMGVLMLAAAMNTQIEIITEGEDEGSAIKALIKLVENKFGEGQ